MAFIRLYQEASEILAQEGVKPNDGAKPLAAVDCYDWTDVCEKQNISIYPTVRIYRKGQGFTTYKDPLDTNAIVRTIKL